MLTVPRMKGVDILSSTHTKIHTTQVPTDSLSPIPCNNNLCVFLSSIPLFPAGMGILPWKSTGQSIPPITAHTSPLHRGEAKSPVNPWLVSCSERTGILIAFLTWKSTNAWNLLLLDAIITRKDSFRNGVWACHFGTFYNELPTTQPRD